METIKLQEDCGIKNIGALYDEIMQTMKKGTGCVLDFSDVRRVDCSVVQVVQALQRFCARKGGKCEIRNADEETARLLSYSGVQ